MRSLWRSPAKHIDLLPQDQVFSLQRCSRLEARSQDTENQLEQIGHQDASLRRPLAASTPNRIFGTHRYVAGLRPEYYAEIAREMVQQSPDAIALAVDNQLISEIAKETHTSHHCTDPLN